MNAILDNKDTSLRMQKLSKMFNKENMIPNYLNSTNEIHLSETPKFKKGLRFIHH